MATKKRSSSIAITCVIVLIAVIAAVVLTSLFKDCKFGHKYDENGVCVRCGAEKAVEENDDAAAALGDDMVFATVNGYGISVIAEPTKASADVPAAIAANSQTLTATITPSEATNKLVDWEIAWKNGASTWASGKSISDYLTVAPSSDGALTATVTCKQAFGEQAIVTVTSRDNPDAKATCTVDYRTRLLGVQLSIDGVKYSNTDGVTLTWMGAQTENSFNASMVSYVNSAGTIDYHINGSVYYQVQFDKSYVEAMAKCSQPTGNSSRADFYAKKSTSTFYANNDYSLYASKALTISHRYFFAAFDGQRLANVQNIAYQVWSNAAATIMKNSFNNKKIATIFVTVPTVEYGTQNFEFAVKYDMANVVAYVESVTVGSSITF